MLLDAGDKVPADLRLLRCHELHADEAMLTGESLPVAKHARALPMDTVLADRRNLAWSGTLVTRGSGLGVVVATGRNTKTGRISDLEASAPDLSTPFTRKIGHMSQVLLWIILALAALTFAVGWLRGQPAIEMFMAAVAMAVGAIPEGLPAAVTVVLALGVKRMASNRWLLVGVAIMLLQGLFTCLPAMQAVFGSTSLTLEDWFWVLTAAATITLAAGVEKWLRRK